MKARSCLLEKVYESTPTGIGAMVSLGTHDYWPDGGKANHSYCEQLATGKPENLIQYYVDVVGTGFSLFEKKKESFMISMNFIFHESNPSRMFSLICLDALDRNDQQQMLV